MSKSLMAHESAVASFKMFSQMVLISFLASVLIQMLLMSVVIVPGMADIKAVKIPPYNRRISTGTMFKYLTGIGLSFSDTVSIPDEFIPLFASSAKLSNFIKTGNCVNSKILKKVLNSLYGDYFDTFPDKLWKTFKN